MRTALPVLVAFAMACAAAGPASAASQAANLAVSATMPQTCTVTAAAINFGDYNTSGMFSNGDITVNCTIGTTYHIALDAGQNFNGNVRELRNPSALVAGTVLYFLSKDETFTYWGDSDFANTYQYGSSLPDTGTGSNQPHTVYGYIFPSSFMTEAGTYTDTVGVTVHY